MFNYRYVVSRNYFIFYFSINRNSSFAAAASFNGALYLFIFSLYSASYLLLLIEKITTKNTDEED